MRFSLIPVLVAAIVTAAPAVVDTLNRRVTTSNAVYLFPGGIESPLNPALCAITPVKTANINFDKLLANKVPLHCKQQAQTLKSNGSPRCALSNLEVVDIGFVDAPGRLWTICHCTDSPVDWIQLAAELGRVPVALRQRTRNFMFFNAQGGAFANSGDVVFLGNIYPTMVLGDTFKNAVAQDSCWATPYARSAGYADAWADINVLVRYQFGAGTTVLREFPSAYFGTGLTQGCLFIQLFTVHYQTVIEMMAGFNISKTLPADTLVNLL